MMMMMMATTMIDCDNDDYDDNIEMTIIMKVVSVIIVNGNYGMIKTINYHDDKVLCQPR